MWHNLKFNLWNQTTIVTGSRFSSRGVDSNNSGVWNARPGDLLHVATLGGGRHQPLSAHSTSLGQEEGFLLKAIQPRQALPNSRGLVARPFMMQPFHTVGQLALFAHFKKVHRSMYSLQLFRPFFSLPFGELDPSHTIPSRRVSSWWSRSTDSPFASSISCRAAAAAIIEPLCLDAHDPAPVTDACYRVFLIFLFLYEKENLTAESSTLAVFGRIG